MLAGKASAAASGWKIPVAIPSPKGDKIRASTRGVAMKTLTAKDAKYRFVCLIDLARAEPVV
jgi:hypothetical protein